MTSNKISRWWTNKTSQGIRRALKVTLQHKKWLSSKYRRKLWKKECSEASNE